MIQWRHISFIVCTWFKTEDVSDDVMRNDELNLPVYTRVKNLVIAGSTSI